MLRILLFPVLLLTALLTIPILLIRQQPYDASPVTMVISGQEGCESPCFLGIRPNVTTADEARSLLLRHPWVTDVVVYRDTGGQIRNMVWDWSGDYPKGLDTSGILDVVDNRVMTITLRTTLTLGDIWLAYGSPAVATVENIFLTASYPQQGFTMVANVTCRAFWQGITTVYIEAAPPVRSTSSDDLAAARRRVCTTR